MNNDKLIDHIKELREDVSIESIASVKSRVFVAINSVAPATNNIVNSSRVSSWGTFFTFPKREVVSYYAFTFLLLLIFTGTLKYDGVFILIQNKTLEKNLNQATDAHERSMLVLDLSDQRLGEFIAGGDMPALTERIKGVTARNRATLDTLQLMGEEGKYSSEECHGDYHRYANYLEVLEYAVDKKLKIETNPTTITELTMLKEYVADSVNEARSRIDLYQGKMSPIHSTQD